MFVHVGKNQQTMLREELELRRIVNWKEEKFDRPVKFSAQEQGSKNAGRGECLSPVSPADLVGQEMYY